METNTKPAPSIGVKVFGVVGVILYLLVGALPYFGSPLVVPFAAALVLWVVWIAGLVVAVRVYQRRPAWTPIVPVVALAFWVFFVQVGSWLFGWTA